jgi:hypothetical protein
VSWLLGAMFAAALFVSLRGVAWDYRRQVWFGATEVSVAQRPRVYLGLLAVRVQNDGVFGAVTHGLEVVTSRSANLDLFADVIRRTPDEVPYWNGSTYVSLVGAFVPRVLWPTKPTKALGQEFGHRYGYLHREDVSTSINLPYLVEFYANFGRAGVVLGMLVVGMILSVLERFVNRPGQSFLVSAAGIVLLLPLLNIESDFSLVFGGLFLTGAALYLTVRWLSSSSASIRGVQASQADVLDTIAGVVRAQRPSEP